MRLIHTADWHLGQLFHGHERSAEHRAFLDWLIALLAERQPDALLIAGDLFDHANPAAQAQQLFYRFLAEARRQVPQLEIVVIAGNHDSAGRLEAPARLLAEFGVQVIGQLQPHEPPARALCPLHDRHGRIAAWCLAIPYLRPGDLLTRKASTPDCAGNYAGSYAGGIAATYQRHLEAALERRSADQAIVAMGHLHASGAALSVDSERRLLIGGEEAVDAALFGSEIAYVALGHLHRAQRVGGCEHIRYSGSPLPLSFTETDYPHQVLEITLEGAQLAAVESLRVPRPVEMLRIPRQPAPLATVLEALRALPASMPEGEAGSDAAEAPQKTGATEAAGTAGATGAAGATTNDPPTPRLPWLEVRVQLDAPEPGLRQEIESALEGKPVRLIKITTSRAQHVHAGAEQTAAESTADATAGTETAEAALELRLEQPDRLFARRYREQWGHEPSQELRALFRELQEQVQQEEQG
ncbi:hypothetical protein CKO15_07710 [Halorhodospira abdelmalekii]|uniref:exonuclease SbcCD subunit D C-terminal domain-containing protein n=1 Tax=Halorhodospira abdelmalekii TaxID=421629 RepID=UPI0019054E7C|nr:exonuclease SbcCD subunit D C-terminal domain-containing protein [Halorhodospira abdelmalekii]MBK1735170.1 hypothetical protein [Halorhodospira abdelmalekii]